MRKKFAINFRCQPEKFVEKFAGNFPKIRRIKIKIHPKSTLQNLRLNISKPHFGPIGSQPPKRYLTSSMWNLEFGLLINFILQRSHLTVPKTIAITDKSRRFQIAKCKIASFAQQSLKNRPKSQNKSQNKSFGARSKDRSVSASSSSQRFGTPRVPP